MRNLKRALSLALASIMLLGMMVTGAGAASNSFTDFDQIVNQEAAEVTSGLGIFDGYTDGSFGPEKVVTRAEMAVIICKLLNGSDVDPGNFTGISKFTDVPAWAEGYVNYCAAAGIVVGVGEGKFNPSATVTTVEAATMLLKALGYFTEEDQLKADWKTVVTGRATSQGLYGSLVLKADEGLTRDNVAELVFHTLFAQRVAYDDNRQLYVKNTNRDVVVTNGTVDRDNTFAMNTFGMWYIDGVVTANSYTEDALSESVNNGPRTDVLFDDPADYMGGSSVAHYAFEYATGLDMIGHAARTYYSIKNRAPVVYAIADRAEKVAFITYDSNSTRLSEAANEAQFRKNSILNIPVNDWKVNYDWDRTVGTLVGTADKVDLSGNDTTDPSKTLLLISNSSDFAVDYVIVLDQYLDTVRRVVDRNGETAYDLTTVNADRQNIALETLAAEDFVIVTNIGKDGQMFILEKPEQVSASISKITGVSDEKGTVKSIVADSTTYAGSPVYDHKVERRELDNVTDFEDITSVGATTLLLDKLGKCIGLAQAAAPEVYAYVAQYAEKHVDGFGTENKLVAKLFLSDGTEGVYLVNTSVGNASNNSFKDYRYKQADLTKLNDVTSLSVYDDDTFNMMAGDFTTHSGLGVFKATVRADGSVVLAKLTGANSTPANGVFTDPENNAANANSTNARAVKGHSTLVAQIASGNMKAGGNVLNNAQDAAVYQTSKTVFFYINGQWGTDGSDLTVGVKTGIDNLVAFKAIADANDDNNNPTPKTYLQVMSENTRNDSRLEGRREVNAELIYGVTLSNDDLFFYRRGNYTVDWVNASRADEKATITFELYNASGERVDQTYNNKGKNFEESEITGMVANKETGWYVIGAEDLDPVVTFSAGTTLYEGDPAKRLEKNRVFVINATVDHVDYENNIYTTDERVGGITKDAVIVDLTDTGLFSSASDIERACVAGHTVKISYYYSTTSDAYKVKAVFVTGYDPYESDVNGNLRTNVYSRYNAGTGTLEVYDNGKASDAEVAASAEAAYKAAGFTVTGVLPRIAMHQDFPGRGYWGMSITREGWNGKTLDVTNSPDPLSGSIMFRNYWCNVDALNMVIVNKRFDNWNVAGTAYSRNMAKENSVSIEVYKAGYHNAEDELVDEGELKLTDKGFTYTSAKYATSTDIYFEIGVLKEITNMPVDMVETLQDKFQGTIEGVEAGGTLPGTTQKNDKVDVVIENAASTPAPGRATAETIVAGKSYDVYINGKLTTAATNVTADENAKLAFTYVVQDYDIAAGKLVITDIQEHTGTVNPPSENDVVVTFTDEVPTLTEGDAAPSITAPSAENATVSAPVWGDIKAPSTTMTITLTLAENAVVKAENCKWGTITPVWDENDKTLTYTVPVAAEQPGSGELVAELGGSGGNRTVTLSAYMGPDGTEKPTVGADNLAEALNKLSGVTVSADKIVIEGNQAVATDEVTGAKYTVSNITVIERLYKVSCGETVLGYVKGTGGSVKVPEGITHLLPEGTNAAKTTTNSGTAIAVTAGSATITGTVDKDVVYVEGLELNSGITGGAIGTNLLLAGIRVTDGATPVMLDSTNHAVIRKGAEIMLQLHGSATVTEGMEIVLDVSGEKTTITVGAGGTLSPSTVPVNTVNAENPNQGKVVLSASVGYKVYLDGSKTPIPASEDGKYKITGLKNDATLAYVDGSGALVSANTTITFEEAELTVTDAMVQNGEVNLYQAYMVKGPSGSDYTLCTDPNDADTSKIDNSTGKLIKVGESVYAVAGSENTVLALKSTYDKLTAEEVNKPTMYGKGVWKVTVNQSFTDPFEKGTTLVVTNGKVALTSDITAKTQTNNIEVAGVLVKNGVKLATNGLKIEKSSGFTADETLAVTGTIDDDGKLQIKLTSDKGFTYNSNNGTETEVGTLTITLDNGMICVTKITIEV